MGSGMPSRSNKMERMGISPNEVDGSGLKGGAR